MSNKKHREYWQRRTSELMAYADRKDIDFFKLLANLYGEYAVELQKEIFTFYGKYADENGLTLQQAKERLRGTDLSDYRRNAQLYRESAEKDPELLDRLNEQYVSSKATRLDALNLQLTYNAALLALAVNKEFERYLKELARHSYRKIIGGRSAGTLNEPALQQLIRTPFQGYNYSEQLWGNTDNLAKSLRKTLSKMLVRGENPRVVARELRDRYTVAQHRAETLVRTDGSMVINNATLKRYNDAGLKGVRIHVHMDERTSDICKEIHKEDKLYSIEDVIKNPILPAHYNCRSTYVPDEKELMEDSWES